MPYNYETQKPELFSEAGAKILLEVRDKVFERLEIAGAVMSGHVFCGDCWTSCAALDFMVERGEIKEITVASVAGQHRVFVRSEQ